MSCAIRRPIWRLRLRHWWRHEGPAHRYAAWNLFLTVLGVAGLCTFLFLLFGLGVTA